MVSSNLHYHIRTESNHFTYISLHLNESVNGFCSVVKSRSETEGNAAPTTLNRIPQGEPQFLWKLKQFLFPSDGMILQNFYSRKHRKCVSKVLLMQIIS